MPRWDSGAENHRGHRLSPPCRFFIPDTAYSAVSCRAVRVIATAAVPAKSIASSCAIRRGAHTPLWRTSVAAIRFSEPKPRKPAMHLDLWRGRRNSSFPHGVCARITAQVGEVSGPVPGCPSPDNALTAAQLHRELKATAPQGTTQGKFVRALQTILTLPVLPIARTARSL